MQISSVPSKIVGALSQFFSVLPGRAPTLRPPRRLPPIVHPNLSTGRSRRVPDRIRASRVIVQFQTKAAHLLPIDTRGQVEGTKGAANYENYHLLPSGGGDSGLLSAWGCCPANSLTTKLSLTPSLLRIGSSVSPSLSIFVFATFVLEGSM